ncbi:UNVERIFIED_CONTAM: hypothetical protein HDU68_004384, partial [Siphonaria sp. JEL0065]
HNPGSNETPNIVPSVTITPPEGKAGEGPVKTFADVIDDNKLHLLSCKFLENMPSNINCANAKEYLDGIEKCQKSFEDFQTNKDKFFKFLEDSAKDETVGDMAENLSASLKTVVDGLDAIADAHPILKITWFIVKTACKMAGAKAEEQEQLEILGQRLLTAFKEIDAFKTQNAVGIPEHALALLKGSMDTFMDCLIEVIGLFPEGRLVDPKVDPISGIFRSKADQVKEIIKKVDDSLAELRNSQSRAGFMTANSNSGKIVELEEQLAFKHKYPLKKANVKNFVNETDITEVKDIREDMLGTELLKKIAEVKHQEFEKVNLYLLIPGPRRTMFSKQTKVSHYFDKVKEPEDTIIFDYSEFSEIHAFVEGQEVGQEVGDTIRICENEFTLDKIKEKNTITCLKNSEYHLIRDDPLTSKKLFVKSDEDAQKVGMGSLDLYIRFPPPTNNVINVSNSPVKIQAPLSHNYLAELKIQDLEPLIQLTVYISEYSWKHLKSKIYQQRHAPFELYAIQRQGSLETMALFQRDDQIEQACLNKYLLRLQLGSAVVIHGVHAKGPLPVRLLNFDLALFKKNVSLQ